MLSFTYPDPPLRKQAKQDASAPVLATWLLLAVSVVAAAQSVYFDQRAYGTMLLLQDAAGRVDKLENSLTAAVEQQVLINAKLLRQEALDAR